MSNYDEQFKRALVQQYLAGPVGYKGLSAQHGVAHSVIKRWVALYRLHGDAGLQKKFSHYSAAFKRSVLEHMRQHGLSYSQTAAVFNIRSPGSIGLWERQYDNGGLTPRSARPRGRPKLMPDKPEVVPEPAGEDTRSLKEVLVENEYLRMENAYLKKLDALIQEKKLAAQKKKRN